MPLLSSLKRFKQRKAMSEQGTADPADPERPLRGYGVLVVEDEALTRQGFSAWLTSAGAHVEPSSDAYEAFEKTREWSPDLVVLDIMLPGMTGFQLVHEWTKKDRLFKVMVVSGERYGVQDGLEAGKLGITKYLIKPFPEEELIRAARETILFGDPINSLRSDARAEDDALIALGKAINQLKKSSDVDVKVERELGKFQREIIKEKSSKRNQTKAGLKKSQKD